MKLGNQVKWAEIEIIKLHKEEQKIYLEREKSSMNGELEAGTVRGCELKSKMEPQTERVSGVMLPKIKPTSCRAVVT